MPNMVNSSKVNQTTACCDKKTTTILKLETYLFTSGHEKFILTPANSLNAAACLGNPLASNKPTSVVVPPTSTTIMGSFFPSCWSRATRNAAPLILLVGPLLNVLIGNFAAASPLKIVPSFCVTNTGHLRPRRLTGSRKERIVRLAKARIAAFKIAPFSRSKNPSCATSRDRTTEALGKQDRTMAAARGSWSWTTSMGEKMPLTTTAAMFLAAMAAQTSRISASSMLEMGRPSTSRPPLTSA